MILRWFDKTKKVKRKTPEKIREEQYQRNLIHNRSCPKKNK